MKNNDLIFKDNRIFRVLSVADFDAVLIDCVKKSAPFRAPISEFSDFFSCCEGDLYEKSGFSPEDIESISAERRKIAYKRYTLIAGILPFIDCNAARIELTKRIAKENGLSVQTVNAYLWRYLAYNNISALAPKEITKEKPLTADQKNIRWALNRFFYTKRKNSLDTSYKLMLKEKYRDKDGNLLPSYPSIHQFRYFYKTHQKLETYYISRDGLSDYQRNNRPLLGESIRDFAPNIGTGMLDSTVCDIYLVDGSGNLAGRPILTVCIDAYSGLCNGYYLSFEGGIGSLKGLMNNIVADKQAHCKAFGIAINKEDWDCQGYIPGVLVTDQGAEYASAAFEQIAELGCTVINLPPYRPELKGMVEKFFDVVQNLFKPHLKGKGVIEPDFTERGARDYRKDACLTLREFEAILLHCIIYYNSKRINESFPYTEEMINSSVKPDSSGIWNYSKRIRGANLIPVTKRQLYLTLLPRAVGTFSRVGLKVNKLRYSKDGYTERYLKGGDVTVAYDEDNVNSVFLIENGSFIEFNLIESCFEGKSLSETNSIKSRRKALINSSREDTTIAGLQLIDHIKAISERGCEDL